MIFPAITTTRDSKNRLLYWLYSSPHGPRVRVRRVWAEMQLRMRLCVDARPKQERGAITDV